MEIKSHDNFVGIYDNLFTKDECDHIISEFENIKSHNPSSVFSGNTQFSDGELGRQDYSIYAHLVGFTDIGRAINSRLDMMMSSYGQEYWPIKQVKARSIEIRLQKTPPRGGYHVWHCENAGVETCQRALAWMIYLNDVPEGEGETEFLWQKLKVQPKAGRGLIWPTGFTHTHRGNPVYSCDKYIATGWYYYI